MLSIIIFIASFYIALWCFTILEQLFCVRIAEWTKDKGVIFNAQQNIVLAFCFASICWTVFYSIFGL
jgi:hypothetical protein